MAMEMLTKGPILDWTSDGKLHERFLEWKKKVSVLCKGLRMTKADPEFTCLCIYQWSGERGQNILDKVTFSEADLKNWEKHLEKLEEHCKPRGSKLVAATQYKVLTQGDMELPEYIEKCRQITRRMWMARERQRHGSPECNSPWTQKSNGVSEMFGREPRHTHSGQGHRDCYGHLQ